MTNDTTDPADGFEMVSARLPSPLVRRVESLVDPMRADTAFAEVVAVGGGTVSRSAVLRAALQLGVEALEQRYTGGER